MNDIKFDILNKPKAVQSELDRVMQSYVDSGRYSKEELAEIRKREANKIKEAKVTKKKEEEKIEEPKTIAGKMLRESKMTREEVLAEKEIEKSDKEERNEAIEKKSRKVLKETLGYDNKDQFTADILGDYVYADAREYGVGEGSLSYNAENQSTETTMSHIDVPWFEDGDMNEYLYKDMLINAPKSLPARFSDWAGFTDEEYWGKRARYEGADGKARLRKDLLGFGNKDNVFKIINDKNIIRK